MRAHIWLRAALLTCSLCIQAAERINHAGRILGPEPRLTNTVLFNTPEADAILSALQVFPVTNPWNEDVSRRPVLKNSDAMIAQIISDLSPSRRTLRLFHEMNFVLVPDNQPMVPVDFVDYPEESDPSPYPIPRDMPIETWPRETGTLSLQQWQLDLNNDGGDRHAIVVQPGTSLLWEMWQAKLLSTDSAISTQWQASNGAKFALNSNGLRPLGWTSADAAGLPMFPALVRFDECERGLVEHAVRLVVKRTRIGPIYPATHQASVGNLTNQDIPAMGQRLRLKATFDLSADYTPHERAVLLGLKKYGAIVADNGNFFSISVTPDHRYAPDAFSHLSGISLTNFEVIRTTGPTEGPRSPDPPAADAGPDQLAHPAVPTTLHGAVTGSTSPPIVRWRAYSGPAPVIFDDPGKAETSATFSLPGVYTLLLSADDGVHALAYDAAVVTVVPSLAIRIEHADPGKISLDWVGGSPPYVLEATPHLPGSPWVTLSTNSDRKIVVPASAGAEFFRIRN